MIYHSSVINIHVLVFFVLDSKTGKYLSSVHFLRQDCIKYFILTAPLSSSDVSLHKYILAHHSPGSISDLGIFFKAPDHHLDEAVVVVVTCSEQSLADDVRGSVVKQHLRTQRRTCDRCTDDDMAGSEHYVIKA